jgi:alpha-beta hydrolase superfamily lysophospholipase
MNARLPAAGGAPLAYVSTLAGKRYSTQWTLDRGRSGDGLQQFEFLTEIDPAAIGSGGSIMHQRSLLWCTPDFHPVRYSSDLSGARTELEFDRENVRVRLPDGSTSMIPRAGADFLIDGNIPGQLALVFASLWRSGALGPSAGVRTLLFLTGQLTTVPCEIAPAADAGDESPRLFRTSHKEDVWLNPEGLIQEVRVPHLGFIATLQDDPPPAPDWPDDLASDRPRLTYAPPAAATFTLQDVIVQGPVVPIGATLSIPPGAGPFPGVLFVSGSGTHDRHGIAGEIDIGTHEIIDWLAEHGFVGLRFDTRGAGSTGLGADTLDRGIGSDIADARACLQFLRGRAETAGQPLFLIGHSQGGTEVLALASEEQTRHDVRGVVLMATMGRDLDEVIVDQIVEQGRVLGYAAAQVAEQVETLREAVALVRAGVSWEPGAVPDHVLAMFRTATWLREFLHYRAQDLIARVTCPVLVCQGARDFQVSAERDAERLVAAARAAGVDCSYALFPDLDHLFKQTSHSTLAQYNEPRPVDRDFLTALHRWLAGHSQATPPGSKLDLAHLDDAG